MVMHGHSKGEGPLAHKGMETFAMVYSALAIGVSIDTIDYVTRIGNATHTADPGRAAHSFSISKN